MVHIFKHSGIFFKCLKQSSFRTFCPRLVHCKQLHNSSVSFTAELNTIPLAKMDFLFCDYDFIGFDLDNTLCEYNLNEMVRMEYNVMSDFLVSKGYPQETLKATLDDFSIDFMQRGLILDFERGNIIKLDRNGGIMKATHGTKPLERDAIVDIYGPRNSNCPLMVKIKSNLTDAWAPECISKYRLLLDYFDIPASLAFARCVDVVDQRGENEFVKCGEDVRSALVHMYSRAHFSNEKSDYFKNMKADPGKYIVRSAPRMLTWLKTLRKKKRLFLVTGSNCDLADFVACHSLGPEWRELFDIVVCFARKPFFFTEQNEFKEVKDLKEGDTAQKIVLGSIYSQGNWQELESILKQAAGRPESRGLYFGDNLVQDVFTPTKLQLCDTVAIVEEMNESHPSSEIISSKFWGPMHAEGSWWGNVIKMYPKAFLSSINLLSR
uniref:5'-nucleotidase domain-containing protein 1 n=1 Tax=Lygus hesperus TaxID=30085 RepID=A0A0A9WU33_LYGHE